MYQTKDKIYRPHTQEERDYEENGDTDEMDGNRHLQLEGAQI